MIRLDGVVKKYRTRVGLHTVLDSVSLEVKKGDKVGILGKNGAGKSTLIRIISGAELPNSGRVVRGMSVSWPLAFSGAFQGSLTGLDNTRFLCRVYAADVTEVLPFVEEFSELGKYLREPVKTYSSGMRARLAFAGREFDQAVMRHGLQRARQIGGRASGVFGQLADRAGRGLRDGGQQLAIPIRKHLGEAFHRREPDLGFVLGGFQLAPRNGERPRLVVGEAGDPDLQCLAHIR